MDDELNARLVRPLQQGITLHAVIDACHSGTVMDLPYRTKYKPGTVRGGQAPKPNGSACAC